VRVDDIYGNIYDHFAVEFEYANGAKGFHFTRQQEGTSSRNTVEVMGTDGNAIINIGHNYEITGKNAWRYTGLKIICIKRSMMNFLLLYVTGGEERWRVDG
jgi:hypothetical protein